MENINDRITYCENEYDAMEDSDALVIITEWNQFRNLNLEKVKESLKQPYFFDFRNIYRKDIMEKQGFKYIGVGQGITLNKYREEQQVKKEADDTTLTD